MGITKAQMTAKQRDIRMLQLTSKELSELPSETRVYEGVGKMYVFVLFYRPVLCPQIYLSGLLIVLLCFFLLSFLDNANYIFFRFVNVPIDTVNKRLTRESSEASSEITNLEKKLHYHETTHKNSRENLEQILKSGRV